MEYDAFTEGIEPGGLRKKSDIRLLICYILSSVNAPLSSEAISKIMQEKGLANYFEVSDALDFLIRAGNIKESDGELSVCDSGREIAFALDSSLPLSVRDKALEAAVFLLSEARLARENSVNIQKTEKGFSVICHIGDGSGGDLMSVSLYVPDEKQANSVKRNFRRDPESFYRIALAALTGDRSLTKALLEDDR